MKRILCTSLFLTLLLFGQSYGQEVYPSIPRTIERTLLDSLRTMYAWADSIRARIANLDSLTAEVARITTVYAGIAHYDSVITIRIDVTDYVASDEYRPYGETWMLFTDSTAVKNLLTVFDPTRETHHPSAAAFDSANVTIDTETGDGRMSFYSSTGTSVSFQISGNNLLMDAVESMDADSAHVLDYFLFDKLAVNSLQDTVVIPTTPDSLDVANSLVTANSIIDVTPVEIHGGPVGHIYPKNLGAGTFTIASTGNESEHLVVLYRIVKP